MSTLVYRSVQNVNIVSVWLSIKQRIVQFISLIVLIGISSYFLLSSVNSQFIAEAKLSLLHKGETPRLLSKADIEQQIKILSSDFVLSDSIDKMAFNENSAFHGITQEKKNEIISDLSGKFEIDALTGENIVSIKFYSDDADFARRLVSELIGVFTLLHERNAISGNKIEGLDIPVIQVGILSKDIIDARSLVSKSGPKALLIMSLVGFLAIGVMFIKEALRNYYNLKENMMDEYHHVLDKSVYEANNNSKKAKLIKNNVDAKPAFRGIYPWQPEEKISDIITQLDSLRENAKPFRIIMAGEAEKINMTNEAIEMARSFSKSGASVLLVDTHNSDNSITAELSLKGHEGLYDVMNMPALMSEIVHYDEESGVQLVPSGIDVSNTIGNKAKENLVKIFQAWSAVYEVVIFCCAYDNAHNFYKTLDSQFDVGVFIHNETISSRHFVSRDFVSEIDDFDIIFYRQGSYEPIQSSVQEDIPIKNVSVS